MNNIKRILYGTFLASLGFAACNNNPEGNHQTQQTMKADSTINPESTLENGFDTTINNKAVKLYTLNNGKITAKFTNYGGRLVSLLVPDKNGKLVDVVLGLASVNGYIKSSEPYFGATIGRFGNRIANAKFALEGKNYTLFKNNGPTWW